MEWLPGLLLLIALLGETMRECRSVQALQAGAYADEPQALAKTTGLARARHLRFRGKHREPLTTPEGHGRHRSA
ncbi:MAG TPA: hypothetical protein VFC31_14465 [Candidatus Limnocylindria bacterium]|nr:hypothetical protein [Candidatus Limnocylindria bacterium]